MMEITITVLIGLAVSVGMVLALREGAVRVRDGLITLSAGIAGAVVGGGAVQTMHGGQDNMLVVAAAAMIIGALAAAVGEILASGHRVGADRAQRLGASDPGSRRSRLIERTIIRLREDSDATGR
jgi:hypothetical protein